MPAELRDREQLGPGFGGFEDHRGGRHRSHRPSLRSRLLDGLAANPALSVVVVVGLVIGLVIRIWALGRATINSDNAVVGLMAHEILHGHFFAFYWGQAYGGVEAYVVAAVFWIFGQSPFTLGLTPLALCALSTVLLWRIGNRLFAAPVGAIAAVAFWVWPETYVTSSVVEDGFRWLVMVCGLVVVLTVLRIGDDEARSADWLLMGLAAGVGWWGSPEIVYFLAPSGLYLVGCLVLGRGRPRGLQLGLAALAALVGSLPWWWHDLGHSFDSLVAPPAPVPPHGLSPFVWHLGLLGRYVVPIVAGLRLRDTGAWLGSASITRDVAIAAGVVFAVWLGSLVVRRKALLLVGFVVIFPFVYAASPFAWYWEDGRYGVFLAPMAALAVAALVVEVTGFVRRGPLVVPALAAALVLAGGLLLTGIAIKDLPPYLPDTVNPILGRTTWWSWHANPNNLPTGLAQALAGWGVHDAFAGYWLSYDVGFLSDGQVTVSPSGPHFIRYPPYFDAVSTSPNPAWLFVSPGRLLQAGAESQTVILDPGCTGPGQTCLSPQAFETYLRARSIGYVVHLYGPYIVVVPDRRVLPGQVLPRFGIS